MTSIAKHVNYAAQFCISRAGTGNGESTRALANCVEHDEADKVLAALVRRAHNNPKLNEGVQLLFVLESLNNAAKRYGVEPLKQLDPCLPLRKPGRFRAGIAV